MSSAEVIRHSSRSRKALNDLQFASNGKGIVGKVNQFNDSRKNLEDTPLNPKLCKTNKRNSISLPDIASTGSLCNTALSETIKSAACTPNKSKKATNTSTPSKSHMKKNNISIIFEDREKENPNFTFNMKLEKSLHNELLLSARKEKATGKKKQVECKEIAIQCNKMDEDMLLNEEVDTTNYWKLLAHKRFKCLTNSLNENKQLNLDLTELDQKNGDLRDQIKKYTKLLEQSQEITKAIMESIECEDSDEVDDSGYDATNPL